MNLAVRRRDLIGPRSFDGRDPLHLFEICKFCGVNGPTYDANLCQLLLDLQAGLFAVLNDGGKTIQIIIGDRDIHVLDSHPGPPFSSPLSTIPAIRSQHTNMATWLPPHGRWSRIWTLSWGLHKAGSDIARRQFQSPGGLQEQAGQSASARFRVGFSKERGDSRDVWRGHTRATDRPI